MSKVTFQIHFVGDLFRGTFWIRTWSVLSKEKGSIILKEGCRALEAVALEIFHKFGWNALRRIEN
jgi:hypothetical protein